MSESSAPHGSRPGFRAGFVAIVGRPNVGKSTLLNAFLGEPLSIVTPKAQTTQRRLLGICSQPSYQAVFVDTPGLLEPRDPLQRSMRAEALSTLDDADVVLGVVDAGFEPSIAWAKALPISSDRPALLCLNKVDRVSKREADELAAGWRGRGWAGVYRTRADRGEGVAGLLEVIGGLLPESPPLYPPDELSDAPVRDFVAEMIRETCPRGVGRRGPVRGGRAGGGVPRAQGGRPTYIDARLYVERNSQKRIVVGAGGRTIRRIGTRSRGKIERFLGHRVFLELRVRVLANWRRQSNHLRLLGFRVPSEER